MKKLESSFVNMVLVLTIITVVVAAGLGAMYNVTKDPIQQAKKAKQEAAIREVLPPFDSIAPEKIVNESKVFRAFDADHHLVGIAIETWAPGFGGQIKAMVGIDAKGTIVNYSLLEHAETPGLGSKLVDWFKVKSDIRGTEISASPLAVSKDGGNYDAITAATISSRAFMAAVNKAIETYGMCFDWASGEYPDAFSEATTLHQRRVNHRTGTATATATPSDTIDTMSAATAHPDSIAAPLDTLSTNLSNSAIQ